jgi:hypothetical protein
LTSVADTQTDKKLLCPKCILELKKVDGYDTVYRCEWCGFYYSEPNKAEKAGGIEYEKHRYSKKSRRKNK